MNPKNRFQAFLCILISIFIVILGVFSVTSRVSQCIDIQGDTTLMAACLMMNSGSFSSDNSSNESGKKVVKKPLDNNKTTTKTEKAVDTTVPKDEATYPITEVDLSSSKLYDNVSLRNTTSYTVDVKERLSRTLPFEISDTRQAQVLIVHTHTCESYMDSDSGFYYESFYPRTTDNEKNVYAVGEAIAKSLKEENIGVVHAKTQHDYPSYDGAYSRSYDTIMSYLEKYEGIKVVLDIHRDSMTTDSNARLKPTFYYNGKKGAQIMIMAGHDSSYTNFPTWEDNLTFALKLQNTCESMYQGMTRPLSFGDFTYNMNANSGSLLIEVGTDANTLDEAVFSGELLGNALAKVLQKS
ncbi:MAG: stage II sporulation protein P [Ruminococcus sp.]|nr:stage II sporulation protein P [Ruminococcus sp.]